MIGELDRADEPFEAFLLQVLADDQLTVPEYGTINAEKPPLSILTSHRTRDLHDAGRRRCINHWLDYPESAVELRILQLHVPDANADLGKQIVAFVRALRRLNLVKNPGVAETIDRAAALVSIAVTEFSSDSVQSTMGDLLKHQNDLTCLREAGVDHLLEDAFPRAQVEPR